MKPRQSPGQMTWSEVARQSFGPSFWIFALLAAVAASVCYLILGEAAFADVVASDSERLGELLPRVAAAQVVAGFVWVLMPRDRVSAFLERNRGHRGLLLATIAGFLTPGGPASAFPFLAILAGTGADRGILIAYITSWATLGMQRIIIWDIALMGFDFSLQRFLVSLPLPILAGLAARRLPVSFQMADTPAEGKDRQ